MADRNQPWGQDEQEEQRRIDESGQGRERGRRGDPERLQGMNYPGGGFGSEHRGYAHAHESQPGYGAQGSSGYEGGPGFGLPGGYGSHSGSTAPAGGRDEYGGYGPRGAGYGAQSSYASHGGYGSPGERWQRGYGSEGGFRSQGYGTHAGYGSHGGYGPQGDEHWPQSSWAQQGNRAQKRGPKGYKRSDERIREDLCERLMHSDFIDSSEVTIEVTGGKVVMDGTVPHRRMKHAIEDMAEATLGVTEVENKVRVEQAGSQSAWSGSASPAAKKE